MSEQYLLPIGAPSSALRTYIFRALGWKVLSYEFDGGLAGVPPYECFWAVDPDGNPVGDLRLYNAGDAWDLVPNWPEDNEAAMTLIPHVERSGYRCLLIMDANGMWSCGFLPDLEASVAIAMRECRSGTTIAEAICMAFWQWNETRREVKP